MRPVVTEFVGEAEMKVFVVEEVLLIVGVGLALPVERVDTERVAACSADTVEEAVSVAPSV